MRTFANALGSATLLLALCTVTLTSCQEPVAGLPTETVSTEWCEQDVELHVKGYLTLGHDSLEVHVTTYGYGEDTEYAQEIMFGDGPWNHVQIDTIVSGTIVIYTFALEDLATQFGIQDTFLITGNARSYPSVTTPPCSRDAYEDFNEFSLQ